MSTRVLELYSQDMFMKFSTQHSTYSHNPEFVLAMKTAATWFAINPTDGENVTS